MKIFQATIICSNSCYIETVLVIANEKDEAHTMLCTKEGREVQYKRELKAIEIDMSEPNIIEGVGFGENDSNYGDDD